MQNAESDASSKRVGSAMVNKMNLNARLGLEETKRSSSAPQKRLIAPPQPPEERLQFACEQSIMGRFGDNVQQENEGSSPTLSEESSRGVGGCSGCSISNSSSTTTKGVIEDNQLVLPPFPAALPKRRTSLLRAKIGENKGDPIALATTMPRRSVTASTNGSPVNLSLDGIGMNRSSRDETTPESR